MFTSYIVVTLITIAANAGMVIADFSRSKMVLANGAEVGVPESWVPLLGTLKAAGAAGLLLGLLGFRLIGIAAAVGLTLFFIGAVAAHVRAKVYYNLAFPGGYLALAVASLVFAVAVADL